MSVEALPLGVKCNLGCTYCYQEALRETEAPVRYDLQIMKRALADEVAQQPAPKRGFSVFGGEPLLVPLPDLEELLKHSFELSGQSGVQTNATLITDAHLELFAKYRTHVGVSLDGPGELNDARWAGTLDATRVATARSEAALCRLLDSKTPCSLIVTLHRLNASPETLPKLIEWFAALGTRGLRSVNLHLLEVDSPRAAELRLEDEDAIRAFATLFHLEPTLWVRFTVFDDMLRLLRAEDEGLDAQGNRREAMCVWNACDPGRTPAVRGVGPRGERLNCHRTDKGGRSWLQAATPSFARQLALHATPQADGGCADCRFFVVCKGQCPGEAIDGDPRNRSANCAVWYGILSILERALVDARVRPVSLREDREKIEAAMLGEWAAGRQVSVMRGVELAQRPHPQIPVFGGWHGDAPHGDAHGDHTDIASLLPKVERVCH